MTYTKDLTQGNDVALWLQRLRAENAESWFKAASRATQVSFLSYWFSIELTESSTKEGPLAQG